MRSGICRWRRALILGGLVGLLWLVSLAVQIARFAAMRDVGQADVAIVLGAAVWDERPSPVFAERINHAVTLYEEGVVKNILFTGGVGHRDKMAEAEVGRQFALEQGVPAAVMFVETTSRVTVENLTEACRVIVQQGWTTAAIVSDPLHMKRAMRMADDLGMAAMAQPTPTSRYHSWRSRLPSLLYETWFYALYLVSAPLLVEAACTGR